MMDLDEVSGVLSYSTGLTGLVNRFLHISCFPFPFPVYLCRDRYFDQYKKSIPMPGAGMAVQLSVRDGAASVTAQTP
jgi:hypothetical protein